MDRSEFDNMLRNFISGSLDAKDLKEAIDDLLFELRRESDLTSEQELLSNLELYLHEAEEGYRSWYELHDLILSVIQRNLSELYVKTVTLSPSETSELNTVTKAIPVRDYPLVSSVS